ncbi:cell division control protein 48 homolog C-like isoform X2 [Lotus japonicus]|uniref:cell division control protein 48 homolog C-like isoform X2 n=1 Tax=Lotus japonicus TaxID=34305 RepID=UPI002583B546|nr:cell division control protein 48 homolog C-like isoform X2 [Lotus japonicus]
MRRRNALQETLRRRVEACKSTHATAAEIVKHLRFTYSADYHRTKRQTLTRLVHEALQSTTTAAAAANTPTTRKLVHDDDGVDECRKKRRKTDEGEVRLQIVEASVPRDSERGLVRLKTNLRELYKGTVTKNVELEMGNSRKATSTVNEGEVEVKGKRFRDFGGMKKVLERLKREVLLPLCHPKEWRMLGHKPEVSGVLLHGPPGCGKTELAHAIANETRLPLYPISATALVSAGSGSSEANIRDLFSKAYKTAPSIIFIDEIDAIASKRENSQHGMENRMVSQLLTCMNQSVLDSESSSSVLVIGATNRPDAVDPALRRPGRFDCEINIGIPDESAREDILSVLTRGLLIEGPIDLKKLARSTPGFAGADLVCLVKIAGKLAMLRIVDERYVMREFLEDWLMESWSREERDKLALKMSDFEEAIKVVQPSTRREGFSSIPNVKWEDVGGLDSLRDEFEDFIIGRIKDPELYECFGSDHLETGFLLYGPPGCGKTLIAKAVANAAGANFIYIQGPELLNKYVGESELAVRTLFSRARTCAPCILFLDEVDALTTRRSLEGGRVTEGLVNQLLTELDGKEQRKDVYVIGTTNRPEAVDRAILRPGRLGKHLYVPHPSPEDRVKILKALARDTRLDAGVDLNVIGRMEACENMSGAELRALMGEVERDARREVRAGTNTTRTIKTHHFDAAFSKISASKSDKVTCFQVGSF